jgi:DNA-binding transcriptional MerR regulator
MSTNFTIKEVATRTGVSIDTLRYYERIGLIHPVERLSNTHRRYSEADIGWIEFLLKLRATGMSIQQMCAYTELQRKGDASLKQRVAMLKEHREKLEAYIAEMNEYLALIAFKITTYEGDLAKQPTEISCNPS